MKSREMFGKRVKDMNKYEKSQYYLSLDSVIAKRENKKLQTILKGRHRNTTAFKLFGKRYRSLNEDELREYYRLRKQEQRRREANNDNAV